MVCLSLAIFSWANLLASRSASLPAFLERAKLSLLAFVSIAASSTEYLFSASICSFRDSFFIFTTPSSASCKSFTLCVSASICLLLSLIISSVKLWYSNLLECIDSANLSLACILWRLSFNSAISCLLVASVSSNLAAVNFLWSLSSCLICSTDLPCALARSISFLLDLSISDSSFFNSDILSFIAWVLASIAIVFSSLALVL